MFFRKNKHPMTGTLSTLEKALDVIYYRKSHKKHQPTSDDLKCFDIFEKDLIKSFTLARYIIECMSEAKNKTPQ